ncbi:MAG: HDOD domain-containing protein [Janthinobacterium sp.]
MNEHIDLSALQGGAILPSPAWQRRKLQQLCQQQVPLDELAEQISSDPAMSGTVIGLANAALAPRQRSHAAVSGAMLASIGLPALHQAFAGPAAAPAPCDGFDQQRYWAHALAMACAARLVGDALRLAPADELFTCGLLARSGQLALASLRPQAYAQLLRQHGGGAPAGLLQQEARRFGHHQLALSGMLMRGWGMPELLCDAVLCHAAPPGCGLAGRLSNLAWLLKLASAIADLILLNGAGQRGPAIGAARALGLDAERLETLLRHSNADWTEWQNLRGQAPYAAPMRAMQASAHHHAASF